MLRLRFFRSPLVVFALALGFNASIRAQTDHTVYDDALVNNWGDWSWATVDVASTAAVHTGNTSIAVTAGGWAAPANARTVVDERYVLAAAGLLAIDHPDAAARLVNTL